MCFKEVLYIYIYISLLTLNILNDKSFISVIYPSQCLNASRARWIYAVLIKGTFQHFSYQFRHIQKPVFHCDTFPIFSPHWRWGAWGNVFLVWGMCFPFFPKREVSRQNYLLKSIVFYLFDISGTGNPYKQVIFLMLGNRMHLIICFVHALEMFVLLAKLLLLIEIPDVLTWFATSWSWLLWL